MKKLLSVLFSLFTLSSFGNARGTICFTFDDIYFENWEHALPLLKKYNAHVTFFPFGILDEKKTASLKRLQNAGHSIGLHGVNHVKAVEYFTAHGKGAYTKNEIMPQLEICRKNGLEIRAFAYPFSQRNDATDAELFEIFDFLRSSHHEIRKNSTSLAEIDGCFIKKVGKKQLFHGFPASGKFNISEIKAAMQRAAKEKSILVFYAHNITSEIPPSHHIALSQLEELLQYAASLNLAVKGLNELDKN